MSKKTVKNYDFIDSKAKACYHTNKEKIQKRSRE